MSRALLDRIDHLVYAAPDLDAAVAALRARTGVEPSAGGQHPGRGTRNALLRLGPRRYLEVIGPDASQPHPGSPRWFGIDALGSPRLMAWAASAEDGIERLRAGGIAAGAPLGVLRVGSRMRSDGVQLTWTLTEPALGEGVEVVPFLIAWGPTPHPSGSCASGVTLRAFRIEHPDPTRIRGWLKAMDLPIAVVRADAAALVARLSTPLGEFELT